MVLSTPPGGAEGVLSERSLVPLLGMLKLLPFLIRLSIVIAILSFHIALIGRQEPLANAQTQST